MSEIVTISPKGCKEYCADSLHNAFEKVLEEQESNFDLTKSNSCIIADQNTIFKGDTFLGIPVHHDSVVQIPELVTDEGGQLKQLRQLYIKMWNMRKNASITNKEQKINLQLPNELSWLNQYDINWVNIIESGLHEYIEPKQENDSTITMECKMPFKYIVFTLYGTKLYFREITDELSKDKSVKDLIKMIKKAHTPNINRQ